MKNANSKPDYSGHRKRLRQRFLCNLGKDMADYELLELVLTTAIPQRDVKPLAKELINKFGSFARVVAAPLDDLMAIDGIKETTAVTLKVIHAATERVAWQRLQASETPIIYDDDTLLDYCRTAIGYSDVEELRVICMNSKLQVIAQNTLQRGTINMVAIHPREVLKYVFSVNANAIIMVHNHPSGDVQPSKADLAVTKQIQIACEASNIRFFDHIIVSPDDNFSFNDHGLLVMDEALNNQSKGGRK